MLTDAARARLDPTGAYVIQTAAMRLALDAVDIPLAGKAALAATNFRWQTQTR